MGRLQSLFPTHQLDVIIGSLLGDARLECRSIGLRHPITARFRVHHGEQQKDYVFWKYEILKNLISKEPRKITWNNSKRNIHENSWYFHTRSFEEFGIIYNHFYKNGTKILPKDIFNLITPRTLALWFMDDGSNNQNSFTLNIHSFSKKEQRQITSFLKNSYNVNATIVKDRIKFKIAIGRREYKKFADIIRPFIIPSMIYKITNPRNDLSHNAAELENNNLLFSS